MEASHAGSSSHASSSSLQPRLSFLGSAFGLASSRPLLPTLTDVSELGITKDDHKSLRRRS